MDAMNARACRRCGSRCIVPIQYGFGWGRSGGADPQYGGHVLNSENPELQCLQCGSAFGGLLDGLGVDTRDSPRAQRWQNVAFFTPNRIYKGENVKAKPDTTQPFLVIAGGTPKEWHPPTLWLVNPTDVAMTEIHVETGGHYSDPDVGVVESKGHPKDVDRLDPAAMLALEEIDDDELYDFVVWWRIEYTSGGERRRQMFSLFKNQDAIWTESIPVLNRPGWLIRK